MQEAVYRVLTLVSALVVDVPIGTNLGLLHLFWMLLCGKAAAVARGDLPGLECGGVVGGSGAAGVGGAGARELDESSAGEGVGAGGGGGGVLAAASARWVSPGRGRHHRRSGGHGCRGARPAITARRRGRRCRRSRWGSSRGSAAWGAAVRAAAGAGAGRPEGSEPERAPAGAAEAGGGAAGADRCAGDRSRVHRRAVAGGRGDGLGDPAAEEHDRAAGRAPGVSGARPTGRSMATWCARWRDGARDRRSPRPRRIRPRAGPNATATANGSCARSSGRVWCCQTPLPGSPTFTVVAIYDPSYAEPLLVATPLDADATGAARAVP